MTAIRFYSHTRGQFRAFSNFYPSLIEVDGKRWPTVEHYFQAMKFRDKERQEQVRRARSPAEAKRLGRQRGMRADWDEVRLYVMRRGLQAKFTQHEALRGLLLGTGAAHLIEAAPRDYFWGEGADGSGENWLGRLLVELREDLRQRAFDAGVQRAVDRELAAFSANVSARKVSG